ncbi:unnamed protein product [Protopolystoma xenopodis]|uniref:Uncharacterized protein n=1 Tax=Protopolystoma xenopodis TaxID=117903 RepID=A0A448XDT3_9PLAT|nr:unnamed protein product [Protopolystoma xenopodis]
MPHSAKRILRRQDGDDDDDDDDDDGVYDWETPLETFETDIDKQDNEMDEFITFYRVMTQLEQNDSVWYQQLVSGLTEEQQAELKEIVDTAIKCMQQKGQSIFLITCLEELDFYKALNYLINLKVSISLKKSKRIEQTGGYNFSQTTVPATFNFGPTQSPG